MTSESTVMGRGPRYERNYPATIAEAKAAGRWWPGGLTHAGKSPLTLRDLLCGRRDHEQHEED